MIPYIIHTPIFFQSIGNRTVARDYILRNRFLFIIFTHNIG